MVIVLITINIYAVFIPLCTNVIDVLLRKTALASLHQWIIRTVTKSDSEIEDGCLLGCSAV
jgi:hypothetical protein